MCARIWRPERRIRPCEGAISTGSSAQTLNQTKSLMPRGLLSGGTTQELDSKQPEPHVKTRSLMRRPVQCAETHALASRCAAEISVSDI
jgi:hypothetical protein